jgi:ferredoxin
MLRPPRHAGNGGVTVLNIDRIACDARGQCAELLPELLELDDWGYPIVRGAEIPPELVDHARRAVEACPVLAFRLFDDPDAASKVTASYSPAPQPPSGR